MRFFILYTFSYKISILFTKKHVKIRRRIKISCSQLASQFSINSVLVKSKLGLITRLSLKILAHNICYFVNSLYFSKRVISKIKHLVFGKIRITIIKKEFFYLNTFSNNTI